MRTIVTSLSVALIAACCHEVNRVVQRAAGEEPSPPWPDAPDWQRDSAIAGVHAVLDGRATSPEEQHELWCAHKRADGWVYGPVKDAEAKTHPCLVPYDELPAIQRAKDETFRAIVLTLTAPLIGTTEPADHIVQFFAYAHLPEHLQAVSRPFGQLAQHIVDTLPRNPERTVALRKVLEGKDAAVRALVAR